MATWIALTIDRNDHVIIIAQTDPAHATPAPINAFYPSDPGDTWPLAAMTLDLLIRVLLWALALLGAVWAIEAGIGWLVARWSPPDPLPARRGGNAHPPARPSPARQARWGRGP